MAVLRVHLGTLAAYLAAGVAATWPLARYLAEGRLPGVRDVSSYVWGFWWAAHQLTHPGNPWSTSFMAAPVGIQLAYDTTMPLPGWLLSPVTLAFGPAAAFSLLTILTPGLLCYVMYRAAALWLRTPGAVAAGALFGLSAMLGFQVWYHLNIALGALFLPMTLEAAVRLRRGPRPSRAVLLGVVVGCSVLVNQESAVLAAILAAAVLLPWLARAGTAAAAGVAAMAAGIAIVVASPQLIAMWLQAAAGGASVPAALLNHYYGMYGASLGGLFAPSPRLADEGMAGLAGLYTYRQPAEAVTTFGVVLTFLALCGLAARWRRASAWMLALLWLGGAALSLGPTVVIGTHAYAPVPERLPGGTVSLLLPYTWLVRLPGLSAMREADRFAALGLVGAALLAGAAVDWGWRHARPAVAVIAVLAVLEAGWPGNPRQWIMSTTMPRLDKPIAADHSGSIVVDVPFGLRGGLPLQGRQFAVRALLIATADEHPRAISYTSWIPAGTIRGIRAHPFYAQLLRAQRGVPVWPGTWADGETITRVQLATAARDARAMGVGWALLWDGPHPDVARYLVATGFRFAYAADGVRVYRLGPGRLPDRGG